MNRREYEKFLKEFDKRYDKFKKNNLPTPFWDEERQTLEYVYFDKKLDSFMEKLHKEDADYYKMHIDTNLTAALENIAYAGFYYPFTSKYYTTIKNEDGTTEIGIKCGHNHAHSFEEVVLYLYDYPESFSIAEDEEEFYSKQELKYLKRVQKYLLFIGIKDLETRKPKVERFRNKLHEKYSHAYTYEYPSTLIKKFKAKERDFTLKKYYEGTELYEKYEPGEYRALIVDENDDYKLFVEFTYRETVKYKEIKKLVSSDKFEDEDFVVLTHFKILETY